jgi:hypothetical protein
MTTTETLKDAAGRPATGIPPIECPSWCTDPGHVGEHFRSDQTCYSYQTYVTASLDEVEISKYGVGQSQIGAMAYRGFNRYPVVLVHVVGFRDEVDVGAHFTADEARELAQYLLSAADMIDGPVSDERQHR